jgi:hypothetical protein
MRSMRGLALCLVAGALFVAGCGSDDNTARAPQTSSVATTSSGSGQSAAVSATATPSAASLCALEGKGKPKKQCAAALKKLGNGKARNPRAACKGMSKKKTKGVKGKSPFAVCVSAAAKLMAAKQNTSKNGAATTGGAGSGNGNGKGKGKSDDGASDDASAADDAGGDDALTCTDASGNVVPFDSPDVDECDDGSADTSASDSAADDSGDSAPDDGSDDPSADE